MGKTTTGALRAPRRLSTRRELVRKGPVSREDLLKHTVRGDPEETEQFVRFIYDLRRQSTITRDK